MIPKTSRLPKDQFRARGYKTTATPFFLLKTKNNNAGRARIGVVVGKSVHKTAVKRNFWKRQAHAGLSSLIHDERDILIMLSPNVARLTKKGFQDELAKAIAKI
jgi:ribonuclease P protein component